MMEASANKVDAAARCVLACASNFWSTTLRLYDLVDFPGEWLDDEPIGLSPFEPGLLIDPWRKLSAGLARAVFIEYAGILRQSGRK
jgi:hypothetical protein